SYPSCPNCCACHRHPNARMASMPLQLASGSFPSSDFPATESRTDHRHGFPAREFNCVLFLGRIGQVLFPFITHRADLLDCALTKIALVAAIAAIGRREKMHCHTFA